MAGLSKPMQARIEAEEKAKREQEEYEAMKATFEVEEDGIEADDGGNASNQMLGDFIGCFTCCATIA